MAMVLDQLKQVIRRLGRAPLFTAITLITLAIGVGANTVIFSVVEGVLLKPLTILMPEQLIGVWHNAPGIGIKELNMAPSIYFIDREQSTTLQDIGVYNGDSLSVTGAGEPEHVRGLDVTDGTLPLLGVSFRRWDACLRARTTYAGRAEDGAALLWILAEEVRRRDLRDRALHHCGWKAAARSSAFCRSGFHFLDRADDPALIMPMQWDRSKTKLGNFSYRALARLKPGVTMAAGECGHGAPASDFHSELSRAGGIQRRHLRESADSSQPAAAEAGRDRRRRQRACGC